MNSVVGKEKVCCFSCCLWWFLEKQILLIEYGTQMVGRIWMRIKPTARPTLRFFIMAPSFPPCHLLPAMCLCVCLCVPNVLLIRLLIVVLKVRGFFLQFRFVPKKKNQIERKNVNSNNEKRESIRRRNERSHNICSRDGNIVRRRTRRRRRARIERRNRLDFKSSELVVTH